MLKFCNAQRPFFRPDAGKKKILMNHIVFAIFYTWKRLILFFLSTGGCCCVPYKNLQTSAKCIPAWNRFLGNKSISVLTNFSFVIESFNNEICCEERRTQSFVLRFFFQPESRLIFLLLPFCLLLRILRDDGSSSVLFLVLQLVKLPILPPLQKKCPIHLSTYDQIYKKNINSRYR